MKRTSKIQPATQIFALNSIGYKGAQPQFSFAFSATSQEDASAKASKWARYQGFTMSDITVTVATAEQAQCLRDEYMVR